MKKIIFVSFGLLLSVQVSAGPTTYRWLPKQWKPLPYIIQAPLQGLFDQVASPVPFKASLGSLAKGFSLHRAGREIVVRGAQTVGSAIVLDSWSQTIFHSDGQVVYGAGKVFDKIPDSVRAKVKWMEENTSSAEAKAFYYSSEIKTAAWREAPQIQIRQTGENEYEVFWYFSFLSKYQDHVGYVSIKDNGEFLASGVVESSGADGRARLFPDGLKFSDLQEANLKELSGDGKMRGRYLNVISSMNIEVNSPDLTYYYPEEDARFDFPQAYFSMDRSFRWFKDTLQAETQRPVEVRLHIGKNGVSSAAFYDRNIIYLGRGDGVSYQNMLRDASILTHETVHAIIDRYVGLPPEGEGGGLNEGFADLLTGLQLHNPRLGEASYMKAAYRRTLENDMKAYRDFTGDRYRNGSIIAGTFWDLRERIPEDRLTQLAFRTLIRLGKGAQFKDLVPAYIAAASGFLTPEEMDWSLGKFRDRGWVVVAP